VVAITRSSTTAAVKRRKLTAGELFTACYSSILASAAIADSKAKDTRIRDWDRAIADVKSGKPIEELKVPTVAHKPKTVNHGTEEVHNVARDANDEVPWNPSRTKIWDRRWSVTPATQYTKLDARLKKLNKSLRNDSMAASNSIARAPATQEFVDEDQVIRQDTQFEHREPKNEMHLEKREEMVRYLVDQMLLGTSLFSWKNNRIVQTNADLGLQRIQMAERISRLKDGFVVCPNYKWRNDEEIIQERSALHDSVTVLCAKATPDQADIDILVAKICYNMLVSTAPPSIATYNILIHEFTRLRQHHLAQVVVNSFHEDSKFSPNERTVKLILDHYIAKGDPAGFRETTQRMRGMRTGHEISGQDADMRIKRSTVYELAKDPEVIKWAMTNKVVRRGGFLIEKVKRTPSIFESLSRGNLAAHGPATAIRIIQAAIREGQTVVSGSITRIVEHCVTKQDYKAGAKLLDVILTNWDNGDVPSVIECTPDIRYALHRLLALCGIDAARLDRKDTLHSRLNYKALRNLLRHMQLESLSTTIDLAADRIQEALAALIPPIDPEVPITGEVSRKISRPSINVSGIPTANHNLHRLSQTQQRQMRSIGKRLTDCRQIRMSAIEARLIAHAQWVDAAAEETALNIALYDKLSDKSKREFVALCTVNTNSPKPGFSRLDTLSELEAKDERTRARLRPRWHSLNGIGARTRDEMAFEKLILKTA
jgi:hypothetical protein